MSTQPTDAEISSLYAEQTGFDLSDSPAALLDFARAVLAKWGQPAQAAEPVAYSIGNTLKWHEGNGLTNAQLFAAPQPIQARADGFFLLLPQRPKPEAPAGTAGLDWDAYSGAQMLAFGRDCSDAAIAALRTEQPAPAPQQAGERVYAFRRKGLADFCTCDEARYEELSNKPHLFETRIFYTAPQPVAREPLTDEQIDAAMPPPSQFGIFQPPWCGSDVTILRAMARAIEAAHGIKGGQHGTE